MPGETSRFDEFARRKTSDAEHATIHPLVTDEETSIARGLTTVGNRWTNRLYDGPFHLCDLPPRAPAVSLVFVESRDGNTGGANPADLGGGPTDQHLIYEGLSRVAADAVLAGAGSASSIDTSLSVCDPKMVAHRPDLA